MSNNEPSFWKSPLVWGGLASLIIVGFGVWSFFMPACSIGFNQGVVCTSKWYYLSRATPNEVGDTLAGFAGSLAFIWIIATVAMQSQELAAQREELALTRSELKRTADAQVAQLRAMEAQAEIFEDERRMREETRASGEFSSRLEYLWLLCLSENTSPQKARFKGSYEGMVAFPGGSFGVFGLEEKKDKIEESLSKLYLSPSEFLERVKRLAANGRLERKPQLPDVLHEIQIELGQLLRLEELLPIGDKIRLRNLHLGLFSSDLRELIAADIWSEDPQ